MKTWVSSKTCSGLVSLEFLSSFTVVFIVVELEEGSGG